MVKVQSLGQCTFFVAEEALQNESEKANDYLAWIYT